tara:strand:+ start:65 stop:808 length:744 start_codon:yes stop_codon:yes gene_type:complete
MNDLNKGNANYQRKEKLKRLMRQLNIDQPPSTKSQAFGSRKIDLIDEALTHSSANQKRNYEKLEFLGDAVLRLVASEFIEQNFPAMQVGERSLLRAHLVSDRWLSKVGKEIKIEEFLIIGSMAAGDSLAKDTINGETIEALIGAIYQYWNNLEPIHDWLRPFWVKESQLFLENPDYFNSKSALQEWCQGEKLGIPDYQSEERNLDHGSTKRFFCKVYINDSFLGQGWGKSRRESEQEAAREALGKLK